MIVLSGDSDVLKAYSSYREGLGPKAMELNDLIEVISKGELGPYSLKDCVIGYMESALYIYTASPEQLERDARANTDSNMERLKQDLKPEHYQSVERGMNLLAKPLELQSLNDSLDKRIMVLELENFLSTRLSPEDSQQVVDMVGRLLDLAISSRNAFRSLM